MSYWAKMYGIIQFRDDIHESDMKVHLNILSNLFRVYERDDSHTFALEFPENNINGIDFNEVFAPINSDLVYGLLDFEGESENWKMIFSPEKKEWMEKHPAEVYSGDTVWVVTSGNIAMCAFLSEEQAIKYKEYMGADAIQPVPVSK